MSEQRYLGIDIGGTSAKYALVAANGEIGEKASFPTGTSCTLEEFLAQLDSVIDRVRSNGITGVGISSLGIVDGASGRILGGVENMPYLKGLSLVQYLEKRHSGLRVTLCNDARAAALGERWKGCAKEYRSFVCLVLGTGLGGAIVLNGNVWEGAHFRAGELGYLDYQNEETYLEKSVSTVAVTAQAGTALGTPIDGFAFFERAAEGDVVCATLLDKWLNRLAQVSASLIVTLDVEAIVLGGGVSAEREAILPRLREYTDRYLPMEMRGQTAIEAARCANDANLLGAVACLIEAIKNT